MSKKQSNPKPPPIEVKPLPPPKPPNKKISERHLLLLQTFDSTHYYPFNLIPGA